MSAPMPGGIDAAMQRKNRFWRRNRRGQLRLRDILPRRAAMRWKVIFWSLSSSYKHAAQQDHGFAAVRSK
jgi:hypothetical protein